MSIKTEHLTCSEVFSGRWHWNPSCHHLHRNQIVLLIFNNFSIESLVKKRRKHLWRFSIDTTRLCLLFNVEKLSFPSGALLLNFLVRQIFFFLLYRIEFCRILSSSHHRALAGVEKTTQRSVGDFCTIEKLFPCDTLSDSPKLPMLGGFCFHRKFSLLKIEKGRWSGASVEEGWRLERKGKVFADTNRSREKEKSSNSILTIEISLTFESFNSVK